MPKMKRHKGIAKRFKISANGKVKYKKSNMGHLMSGKNGTRCRRLGKKGILDNKPLSAKIARALLA
jgi:large subunit ribosomal protein L35